MKAKTKALLILGYALGIGATLFLVYGFDMIPKTPPGVLMGILIVMMMYMIGALCISEWIKAWIGEETEQ